MREDPNNDVTQEVSRLTEEGRTAALEGRPVPTDPRPEAVSLLNPATLSVEDFLNAVFTGAIEVRGGTRRDNERDLHVFLREAAAVFGMTPPFLKSVASAWARLNAGRSNEDVTRRMARGAAGKLRELWELGARARCAESVMRVSLHRIDVRAHARAAGWIDGEIARLESSPDDGSLYFLRKNRFSILIKALKDDDPHYPRTVVQSLPRMLHAMKAMVERMRASSDPAVLEAADHLGGKPGTGRKGNFSSLINHAITSGRLLDYVRDVESRFAGGDIVREIENAIRKLGGKTAEAQALQSNKASFISRSIHHGTLDYRPKWEKKVKGTVLKSEAKLQTLESENRRLRSLVADLMLSKEKSAT